MQLHGHLQDLDLTKPGIQKSFKRAEFETTTAEVLRKADFRVSPYLTKTILLCELPSSRKIIDIHSGYVLTLLVPSFSWLLNYYGLPVLITHLVVCFLSA